MSEPGTGSGLRPRVVYTDLDGTLLGPGGSLFASPGGGITGRPAEAVAALHRAGVALVPVSGRAEVRVKEAARLLGA
ncbi:MAG: HAD family hydrolase, partial [Actinomycetota bacterium]